MVRNYKRKTDRATAYSRDQLLEAVEKVKNGELSAYRASLEYKIPRPTIVARVYGRYGLKSDSLGRSTVLTAETEKKLAKNIHIMEKYGFGLTREEILELVGQYIAKNNIPNNFKNGRPGEDWFLSFKKRHALSVKKPQAVENSRKKACNPWVIYSYYELLKNTLDQLELHDKPSQIWNLDETSFSKDPSKTKVVGLRGYASTRTIASPGKDNTTVLLGCSAAGDKTPPLIVYKGKNLWDEWISEEGFPGTVYAATSNGWMEAEVFETFFQKVFLPTVGDRRPILLVYDGHSTHVGINIIEKARQANITILKIPPHTSDNLQPLDLAVNKSFKDKWDKQLVNWQRLHVGQALPKKEFSKLIGQVWAQIDPRVCIAGFRKAGIYPFNSNAVSQEKFHPDQLVEWKKQQERLTENVLRPFLVPSLLSLCINRWNSCNKANIASEQIHLTQSSVVKNSTSTTSKQVHIEQSFVAKNSISSVSIAPEQVYNEQFSFATNSKSPRVIILEDRPVNFNITFEDLLLDKISAGTHNVKKRKKVASGAEIITSAVVYKRQKELEEAKIRKLKQKEEKLLKKNTKQKKVNKEKTINKSNREKRKNLKSESSQKKKKIKTDDSTSESDIDIEFIEESDEDIGDYFTGLLQTTEDDTDVVEYEDSCSNDYDEPTTSTVLKSQWVLVKFTTKTSVKHYIGVVTELNSDGIPTVKFVRKSIFRGGENRSTFVFPNVPDICEVRHLDDIVCKLPDPIIGRRGQISFKMSFEGYNIQ